MALISHQDVHTSRMTAIRRQESPQYIVAYGEPFFRRQSPAAVHFDVEHLGSWLMLFSTLTQLMCCIKAHTPAMYCIFSFIVVCQVQRLQTEREHKPVSASRAHSRSMVRLPLLSTCESIFLCRDGAVARL